jgi:hypothetical protein
MNTEQKTKFDEQDEIVMIGCGCAFAALMFMMALGWFQL